MVTAPERMSFDETQLLVRFPGDAALVARLLVQNDSFRNACEDFVLAMSTLTELEAFQRERQPMKITEYRQIVAELEREISEAIEHAKRST